MAPDMSQSIVLASGSQCLIPLMVRAFLSCQWHKVLISLYTQVTQIFEAI